MAQYIPVRAEVKNLPMLSAHADAEEILRWLRNFRRPPRMTFVTHGEPTASDVLRRRIQDELGWRATVPGASRKDGPAMSSDPLTLLVAPADVHRSPLRARRLGVHTHDQAVVFMRTDCHVCRSEGLTPHSRVLLSAGERETIATLYQVSDGLVGVDEAGLSEAAWTRLGLSDGDPLLVRHPDPCSRSAASAAASTATASMSRPCAPSWLMW